MGSNREETRSAAIQAREQVSLEELRSRLANVWIRRSEDYSVAGMRKMRSEEETKREREEKRALVSRRINVRLSWSKSSRLRHMHARATRLLTTARLKRVVTRAFRTEITGKRNGKRWCSLRSLIHNFLASFLVCCAIEAIVGRTWARQLFSLFSNSRPWRLFLSIRDLCACVSNFSTRE